MTDEDDPVRAALDEALDQAEGDETRYHIRQAMQHRLAVLDGGSRDTQAPEGWLWATNRGYDAGAPRRPTLDSVEDPQTGTLALFDGRDTDTAWLTAEAGSWVKIPTDAESEARP